MKKIFTRSYNSVAVSKSNNSNVHAFMSKVYFSLIVGSAFQWKGTFRDLAAPRTLAGMEIISRN